LTKLFNIFDKKLVNIFDKKLFNIFDKKIFNIFVKILFNIFDKNYSIYMKNLAVALKQKKTRNIRIMLTMRHIRVNIVEVAKP
jgi:hypothetical protein